MAKEKFREKGDQLLILWRVASTLPKSVWTNTSHLYSQQVEFRAVTGKVVWF